MKNVNKILLNPKITRGELSKVYKEIKILNLGIPWLDILRKTTRVNVATKWEKAYKAKQMDDMNNMKKKINKITNKIKKQQKEIKHPLIKFIVSGIMIKTEIITFKNGREQTNTFEEKYNESFKATDKKDAIRQAKEDITNKDIDAEDYSGGNRIIINTSKTLKATPYNKFKNVSELKTKMKNIVRTDYDFSKKINNI